MKRAISFYTNGSWTFVRSEEVWGRVNHPSGSKDSYVSLRRFAPPVDACSLTSHSVPLI